MLVSHICLALFGLRDLALSSLFLSPYAPFHFFPSLPIPRLLPFFFFLQSPMKGNSVLFLTCFLIADLVFSARPERVRFLRCVPSPFLLRFSFLNPPPFVRLFSQTLSLVSALSQLPVAPPHVFDEPDLSEDDTGGHLSPFPTVSLLSLCNTHALFVSRLVALPMAEVSLSFSWNH